MMFFATVFAAIFTAFCLVMQPTGQAFRFTAVLCLAWLVTVLIYAIANALGVIQ